MQRNKIPVSVLVATKNEEVRIARCLDALSAFDELVVVDSGSDDATCSIAREKGARVERYVWDGQYPKKRQWCLDNLELKHDWVFFVDADELVTDSVVQEISALFDNGIPITSGYFVRADYVWQDKMLQHGLSNNKLVLFDRRRVEFPVVDDLDLPGMGEMEGHYQPVLKVAYAAQKLGQIDARMVHYACDDIGVWDARHERYARWEQGMNLRDAWPHDPVPWRQFMKRIFRSMPFRDVAAFLHCYIFKLGFLDGARGLDFALCRARYYRMIRRVS